jgi:ATP-dependent Clp protease ATP-binding subunit ClpA
VFERFTEQARQVVVLAMEEARGLKHNEIGSEHLLLGMVALKDRVASTVLEAAGLTLKRVRPEVVRLLGEGQEEVRSGSIPFTPRAKQVFEFSLREAQGLGDTHIDTEHLLLALLRTKEALPDATAQIIDELGVNRDTLRDEALNVRQERSAARRRRRSQAAHQESLEEVTLDPRAREIWDSAVARARNAGRTTVMFEDLLEALLSDGNLEMVLSNMGVDVALLRVRLRATGWSGSEAEEG